MRIRLNESKAYDVSLAEILQGESTAEDPHGLREHNTFEEPDRVQIRPFTRVQKNETDFELTLPAASVVHLTLQKN